jgi:hypothetical protein
MGRVVTRVGGTLAAFLVAVGCGSGTPTPSRVPGWDTSALGVASRLATTIRSGGGVCDGYAPADYAALPGAYAARGLPIPAASSSCTAEDDEDLTFEVFATAEQKAAFVEAKRRYLCAIAAGRNVPFDGFAYVDGVTWIVEPDDPATAARLATSLHATAARGGC